MSIAQSILDIVIEEMQTNGVKRMSAVRLKIGELTAVVPNSLIFCWSVVTESTPAEGSRLDIDSVEVRAECSKCGLVFDIENREYVCPKCKDVELTLLSGRELYIQDLEVPDCPGMLEESKAHG